MKKLNILNYFFLITFTLVCVFTFNINSKALTAGQNATIEIGKSRTYDSSCSLEEGSSHDIVEMSLQLDEDHPIVGNIHTKVTCIKEGQVNINCSTTLSSKVSTITCITKAAETPSNPSNPTTEPDCNDLLTDDIISLLQDVFDIIKFADVVLVVALTIVTFTQAVAKGGDDLKKAINVTIKRVIIGVIIFFIPVLIDFIFDAIGLYNTCGIG